MSLHSKPSQAAAILADLQNGFRLTQMDALTAHGCNRLASRINELKKAGHPIQKEWVESPGGARVARYFMPQKTA